MIATFNNKKITHLLLVIVLVIIQLSLFYFWNINRSDKKELSEAFANLSKPNKALVFSNEANKHYFEAQSNFENYLHNNNQKSFLTYQKELQIMAVYLDSLYHLNYKKAGFEKTILSKKKAEEEVVALKKQLDSLIFIGHKTSKSLSKQSIKFENPSNSNILKSVRLDTIRTFEKIKKKGVIGRLKDAISNKKETEKEVVKIFYILTYENVEKFENREIPFKYAINGTDNNSNYELKKIKSAYVNLSLKGENLLTINKRILNKSQELIEIYSKNANEIENNKYKKIVTNYFKNSKQLNDLILYFLITSSIFILLLIYYAYNALKNEEKIHFAKKEIEKSLDFKNKIIGVLSHEMRAPLSIISATTNEINKHNKDSNLVDFTNTLNFTSKSLEITVNQILDFFKKENTDLVLYKSKFNLKTEITAVVNSLKALGEIKKIEFISKIDPKLDTFVFGDNIKLHQLFYNIIGNALKFTENGNITIQAHLSKQNSKPKLEISIKDSGIGIPPEDLKHIFDKFYQSKHAANKANLGIGLGLNLCKEIVELHQGEIEVKSVLNKGTEISFYLLFDEIDNDAISTKQQILDMYKDKQINVALVDDDLMIISIIKKMMAKINFSVITFNNVADIKKYLDQNKVDIIITDLNISTDSGLEFAKEIKETNIINKHVPIIAITGNDYMNNKENLSDDIEELLLKPIHEEELYTKIIKVLK